MPRTIRKAKCKKLAIYNHKGGVGKTTLTVNIAAALAMSGKKVLLVDSDPQCNLTSYLFEDAVVDSLLDASDGPKGETLWSALKPIVESKGSAKEIPQRETNIDNLFVIPGDIRLSEFESELNDYWGACLQRKVRGFDGTLALSLIVNDFVNDLDADFVFYDTGPNIGPLNRIILLDCDYFIVPGACDLFSVRALKTLGHTLVNWIKSWEVLVAIAPDEAPLLTGHPAFLGYIPQQFRVYNHGMTRISSNYQARFRRQLFSDVITPLRCIDQSLASDSTSPVRLGEVRNFTTLVQQAQEQGVPLWQTVSTQPYQCNEVKETFMSIAKAIIDNV